MNLDRLREIIDLVAESDVSEIEIEEDGLRIVVRKQVPLPVAVAPPAPYTIHAPPEAAAPTPTVVHESEPKTAGTEVRAPIVGTFFRSPSPEADPYVQLGDRVSPGDVLCIIEAMKLMNEIESEVSGIVTETLVENASPVEFDQPLFIIEAT